ncbi:MAG: NAD(P)/FAD-dependent oxidoreductase [Saccharofermentanales bacterium]
MKLTRVSLPYTHSEADLAAAYARENKQSSSAEYTIVRKSLDARKKHDIRIVYQLAPTEDFPPLAGIAGLTGTQTNAAAAADFKNRNQQRVVVVGAGPAGLFAALFLALSGCRPLLIERGQPVEQRQLDVARFWQGGRLDPESNVQFGEGGAGTFSDGKLTTGIKDPRCAAILEEMVLLGAPPEILYLSKPHIGTDYLRTVMIALRRKILGLGGEIRYGTRLTDISAGQTAAGAEPCLTAIQVESKGTDGSSLVSEELPTGKLILAIGHSARDTFQMLTANGVKLIAKPFAVGVRIEHNQSQIDLAQYGEAAGHPALPAAIYRLSCPVGNGRSLYTFCMCPGGQVIAAASAEGESVTNGMSLHARAGRNANSALLVPVQPDDFVDADPLAGVRFQQEIERRAFRAGGGDYKAPAQLVGSFLGKDALNMLTAGPAVDPSYTNGVRMVELVDILPAFVSEGIKEGLPILARKLTGFADADAVLTGVETRSSSPVRILRDAASRQSSLPGLYPCGEGAGYAGGIISAAVDGLRCAESVINSSQ